MLLSKLNYNKQLIRICMSSPALAPDPSFCALDLFQSAALWDEVNLFPHMDSEIRDVLLSTHDVGISIIRQTITLSMIESLEKSKLNISTLSRGLNFLHISVIIGNCRVTESLIEAGVDINLPDSQGWTPLHYAAMKGNRVMIELLLSSGANQTALTKQGGTYLNILKLCHPAPVDPDTPTNLFYIDREDKSSLLTHEVFKGLTRANFITENAMGEEVIWNGVWEEWNKMPKSRPMIFQEGTFRQKMPRCYLKEIPSCGYGVFAMEKIVAGRFIGEYQGKLKSREDRNPYIMGDITSLSHRNVIPLINDGFHNVFHLCIPNIDGLPIRYMFLAIDDIDAKEQLCFNYGGAHSVKIGPYSEVRPKETRDFVLKEIGNISEFRELLSGRVSLSRVTQMARLEKFRYILNTPSILFSMGVEEILLPNQVNDLLLLADEFKCLFPRTESAILIIPSLIRKYLRVNKTLIEADKRDKALELRGYLLSLPERVGIIKALTIATLIYSRDLISIDLRSVFSEAESLLEGLL